MTQNILESIIETLLDMNIPTHSHIKAIQTVSPTQYSTARYDRLTETILNKPVTPSKTQKHARIRYMYLIQESIKAYRLQQNITVEQLIYIINNKTALLEQEIPWAFKTYETDSEKTKRKGDIGTRVQEILTTIDTSLPRKEILKILVKELDIKPTTASTYYNKYRKLLKR